MNPYAIPTVLLLEFCRSDSCLWLIRVDSEIMIVGPAIFSRYILQNSNGSTDESMSPFSFSLSSFSTFTRPTCDKRQFFSRLRYGKWALALPHGSQQQVRAPDMRLVRILQPLCQGHLLLE